MLSFVNHHIRLTSQGAKERLHAAAVHLALSLVTAAIAATLVFRLWYPYPYGHLSGGRELFLILMSVDVAIGPLITLMIFNRRKPQKELRRDIALVVAIQLVALTYGMWTVYVARPVHLVFEIDRLRVVHAVDVDETQLHKKPANLEVMPMTGPTLLGVRPFKNSNESFGATMAALEGVQIGARPDLWQSWADSKAAIIAGAKPVADLRRRFPDKAKEIEAAVRDSGPATPDSLVYLPVNGRKEFWTAFIDSTTGNVVGFVAIDSF